MITLGLLFMYLFVTFICLILFLVYFLKFLFKKAAFPKKLSITTLSLVIIFSGFLIYHEYFFTFSSIPIEYSENPVASPNNKKAAQVHYEYYGGAAGGVNALVEVTDEANNKKMIYYADAKGSIRLLWKNDTTLQILNNNSEYPQSNRDATLNVETEIYHDTGRACKSILLKNSYEACYQKNSET